MAALAVEAADFELPDGWVPEPVDTKTADAVTPVDYDTLTLKELRSMCAAKGLSKTGTKMVLRARLQLCDTVSAPHYLHSTVLVAQRTCSEAAAHGRLQLTRTVVVRVRYVRLIIFRCWSHLK